MANDPRILREWTPRDPAFERRVRENFARQPVMTTIGATLTHVGRGAVDIELAHAPALTQQHGFLHAGIVTAVLDSACGYAALTLMESGRDVVSVEFKVNLLAPANAARYAARARVVRPGKTVTVCTAELVITEASPADAGRVGEVVAIMTGTMMSVRGDAA